jgi:DNA-directed RNA polymerase specialized sigma24 family protein
VGFSSRGWSRGRIGSFEELSDRVLAARAGSGDESALAALYERYVCDLSDFALWIVRDRDVAADVIVRTFARVWDRLRLGVRVDFVRAWVYTIARDEALESGALRSSDTSGVGPFIVIDASRVSDDSNDHDLVRLVCASAGRLSASDYSLLDLHVRRDLSASELALALGLERVGVGLRLSQLRASLDAPVTSNLLARCGRGGCRALDALLGATDTSVASDVERAIRRHLRGCAICEGCLRRFAAPAEIFARLATVPPSDHFRATTWERVSRHVAARRGDEAFAGAGRTPREWYRHRPGAVALGAAATTLGVAIVATSLATANKRNPGNGGRGRASAEIASVPSRAAFLPPLPTATPSSREPADGATATPAGVRTFAWAPVPGAVGYELVLLKGDDQIFSARTREATLTLPTTWRYQGKPQHVERGTYKWIVWPVMEGSDARAGKATVAARLVID